jgi:hypothetical protein
MKTQKTKLGLTRITLCELATPELSVAQGGFPTVVLPSDACGYPT